MKRPPSKRKYTPESKPFERVQKISNVHATNRWTKTSKIYRQDNPLCEVHDHYGFIVGAQEVDHIYRLQDGGAPFDQRNLMSICTECHRIKTGKEVHKQLIQFKYNEDDEKIPENRQDIFKIFKNYFQ